MSDEQRQESSSVVDAFYNWYHVPVLVAFVVAMLAIRLQRYGAFIQDGTVYFSGNDAWYHLRQVQYTVRHWPFTMPFDPWTYFPFGTNAGQFGTVYDQLVATGALVVGLGSPSSDLVAKSLLVAPAVFGALTAVPVYLVGKRFSGRLGGLFGAAILMLLPNEFLMRGLVGFADHNVAEPFFQTVAVLAILVAIGVAEREKPVWELVAARDFDALRRPLTWSAVAGAAVALYMWVWPPGVLLVGIFGTYLVYKIASDFTNDESPEPVAFVGAVAMLVTAVLMFVPFDTPTFGPTDFSLIQPMIAFLVALGSVFLAFLARQWETWDVDRNLYPVAVFGLVIVGVGVLALALPSLFSTIQRNVLRFIGFSAGAETRTIAEAQPYLSPDILSRRGLTPVNRIISDYGFTLFTGVIGAILLVARPLVRGGEPRRIGYVVGSLALVGFMFVAPGPFQALAGAFGTVSEVVGLAIVALILLGAVWQTQYDGEDLFVLFWAAFITSAAFTQLRFNYYLATVVAVMNAYLLYSVVEYLDIDVGSFRAFTELEGYQVLAIVAVILLVITPALVVPVSIRDTGNPKFDKSSPAWEVANQNGPGSVTNWNGTLQWLSEETPKPGTFGGANNQMEYYGTFKQTDDFEYPDGAYGVMSWWDYGHWITVRGERIPNANPFQQGATEAANFLLSANESSASDVLTAQSTEGNNTRYVMVDWQMASPNSKFGAPVVWYDRSNLSQTDFYSRVYSSDLRGNALIKKQRYYRSLMVRLYRYHGSSMDTQPIVVDWEPRRVQTRSGQSVTVPAAPQGNQTMVKKLDNMSAAREYVEQDATSQIGGVGPYPTERVPALKHYRLVKASESSANESSQYTRNRQLTFLTTGVPPQSQTLYEPSWVKVFERVPGATIEGSDVPANAEVRATVELRVPATNETFTYRQVTTADENGNFNMTLPYSTTGYDEYGPENGYTNVSVRATGPYFIETALGVSNGTIQKYTGSVNVSEGRVNGDIAGAKQIELEATSPLTNMTIPADNSSQNASSLRPLDSATAPAPDSGTATDQMQNALSEAFVAGEAVRP